MISTANNRRFWPAPRAKRYLMRCANFTAKRSALMPVTRVIWRCNRWIFYAWCSIARCCHYAVRWAGSSNCSKCSRMCKKNLDQAWDNAALAKQLHITTTHLHRLCTQHLGETPNKIVFRMKMNQAKELLMHGISVGEVARVTGYQEIASFSRRFRQHFGYNPSQVLSKHLASAGHQQIWT
ncbi:helix-turn-helix domain-containing protein [Deefgea sp. CFH1-16]|nr:helix-turn-helix domain-containing protein [Deefgea sp. CFH1-16]